MALLQSPSKLDPRLNLNFGLGSLGSSIPTRKLALNDEMLMLRLRVSGRLFFRRFRGIGSSADMMRDDSVLAKNCHAVCHANGPPRGLPRATRFNQLLRVRQDSNQIWAQ